MTAKSKGQARRHIWRILGWGGAVALILAPLVAMQFTREVNWTASDFVAAAIMLGVAGGLIELAVRFTSNLHVRIGAILAVLAGFMLVWAELAVGIFR